MATIGKISISIEAQHAAFSKGVKQVNGDLKGLGSTATSTGSIIKTAIGALAIGAGIAAVRSFTSEVLKSTTEAYRLSGSLGITTASLQGLQAAGLLKAGLHAEEFNAVLNKMVRNLGGLDEDSDKAAGTLAKLGISGEKLAGMKTDEAFKTIAQAISEVKSPADRAAAAVAIFGKQGQSLMPLLLEGASGIEEAGKQAERMGLAMSEIDAAKLVAANMKIEEVSATMTGIQNQVVIALAPVLSELAEQIMRIIPPAEKMRSVFTAGLHAAATGVGYLVDAYNVLKIGVLAVAYGGIGAFELMLSGIQKLAEGIAWLHDKLFKEKWGKPRFIQDSIDVVDTWRQSVGNDIKEAFNAPSAVSKVDGFFENIVTKSNETAQKMVAVKDKLAAPLADGFAVGRKKIDEILKGMEADVANFGLTEAEKKINELKSLNAKPEDIAKAQGFADQLKGMEDYKKRLEEAKKLTEESLTPVQKYQDELTKLSSLFTDGMIDAQTYWDQVGKLNKQLGEEAKKQQPDTKVGAETRRFDFAGPRDSTQKEDPMVELKNNSKQQLEAQKRMAEYLAEIYRFGLNADTTATQDVVIDF